MEVKNCRVSKEEGKDSVRNRKSDGRERKMDRNAKGFRQWNVGFGFTCNYFISSFALRQ